MTDHPELTPDEQHEKELGRGFVHATEEDRSNINKLTAMIKSPGWKMFETIMKEQLTVRRDVYELSPDPGSIEFLRGEISAIRIIMALPGEIIEGSKTAIQMRQQQLDEQLDALKGED